MKRGLIVLILLAVVLPVHAWTRTAGFENGISGSDGFSWPGSTVYPSTALAYEGSHSARIHFAVGDDCWYNELTCGGGLSITPVTSGQELWARTCLYFPSGFDWSSKNEGWHKKIMRFRESNHQMSTLNILGYCDSAYSHANCNGNKNAEIFSDSEFDETNAQTGVFLAERDKWVCLEQYALADDSNGIHRVWKDQQLVYERLSADTINSGGVLDEVLIFSAWNGQALIEMDAYVDGIVITTDTPAKRDSHGNALIGVSGGTTCGSSGCESGETCSSCPQDCGSCSCNPDWVCSDWSACTNSQQTRTCTDSNNCGTTSGRPALTQSCTSGTTASECANWQTNHPDWIFCDDFDSKAPAVGTGSYFEIDENNGDFIRQAGIGYGSSYAMRALFQQGEVGAGGLKLAFGRNPSSYMNKGIRQNENFRDIYYRMYFRNDPNWQGDPAKLSRATVIAKSDWGQAMIGHLWSDGSNRLLLDPASCISGSTVLCSGYNDFDNLDWLGSISGKTTIFDGNHDNWMCIEHHVKLNDAGRSNGLQEFWIDGTLEAQKTGLNFVGSYTDYGINAIFLENYWNDGSVKQQERWFDNFVVSTQRIGCVGAGQTPVKCTAADTDSSGIISITELNAFIARWKFGQENLASLMEVIKKWKSGC